MGKTTSPAEKSKLCRFIKTTLLNFKKPHDCFSDMFIHLDLLLTKGNSNPYILYQKTIFAKEPSGNKRIVSSIEGMVSCRKILENV